MVKINIKEIVKKPNQGDIYRGWRELFTSFYIHVTNIANRFELDALTKCMYYMNILTINTYDNLRHHLKTAILLQITKNISSHNGLSPRM